MQCARFPTDYSAFSSVNLFTVLMRFANIYLYIYSVKTPSKFNVRTTYPFTIDVLPPMIVDLHEFEEHGVHRLTIQSAGGHFYHGKHSAAMV